MPTFDDEIEDEIERKNLTGPRVTPADIDAAIHSVYYFTAADGIRGSGGTTVRLEGRDASLERLTVCVIVLRNGFTVTGEAACVSAENFDPQIGRQIAKEAARKKIWMLEGYLLRQALAKNE